MGTLQQPEPELDETLNDIFRILTNTLHRVLAEGEVVDADCHSGGNDGRAGDAEELQQPVSLDKLQGDLLVTQQRAEITASFECKSRAPRRRIKVVIIKYVKN